MLIQERECIEKYNLRYDSEKNKYELPFDISELSDYNFVEPMYLGKEKSVVSKSASAALEQEKVVELNQKAKLAKEFAFDFSNDIVFLIRQTLMHGVVLF